MLKKLKGLKVSVRAPFKRRVVKLFDHEDSDSSNKHGGQTIPTQDAVVATSAKQPHEQNTQPNHADGNGNGNDHVPPSHVKGSVFANDLDENPLPVEQHEAPSSNLSTSSPAPTSAGNGLVVRDGDYSMTTEAMSAIHLQKTETGPHYANNGSSHTPPSHETGPAFVSDPQENQRYEASSPHSISIPSSASTASENGEIVREDRGQFSINEPTDEVMKRLAVVHVHRQDIMANKRDVEPQVSRSVMNSPLSGQGSSDSGSFTYSTERRAMEILLATNTNESERKLVPSQAFQGARDFVVNSPIFLDTPVVPRTKAMKLLARKTIFSASLTSNARFPPPSCLKGTRMEVRNRILTWITDMNRESNLLWLYGPAGAGISAICQTTAKHCKLKGWLGAAFFFSRKNQGEDSTKIIPSLAYQLATTYPTYKDLITSLLNYDHSVLEEALPSQFEKLIVAPLSKLTRKRQNAHPILILLDGLDACPDPRFQREFIRQVGGFAAATQRSRIPVVWIIATRREWEMTTSFESMGSHVRYRREELRIDTEDAKQDVQRFVRDGFKRVRQNYGDAFAEGSKWPAENQLSVVDSTASGLFAFASDVVNFVNSDDPVAKLNDCLEYLGSGILPQSGNPLHSLHVLYQDILGAVHPDVFRSTKRILSFLALGARGIPAQDVASFLSLGQSTFYGSLRRLHSVMEIPTPKEATGSPLVIIHASFREYLKQRIEFGHFDFDARMEHPLVVADMEKYYMTLYRAWKEGSLDRLLSSNQYYTDHEHNFMKFAMQELWAIWSYKGREEIPNLCTTLRQFDFSEYDYNNGGLEKLAPLKYVGRYITILVCLLSDWQKEDEITDDYPVLRLKPWCEMDKHLFREHREVVTRLQAKVLDPDRLKSTSKRWCYRGYSLKQTLGSQGDYPSTAGISSSQTMYFFLGHGANTCLVFAY